MDDFLSKLKNERNNFFFFCGLFLISFLWLLIFTPEDGLWYDECFTLYHSQGSYEDIINVSKWDSNPPLFLMIIKKWIEIVGYSEFKLRLFSVIMSSLFISSTVIWVKTILGKTSSLFACLLLFFSEAVIDYSHEARAYSLLFFLITINSILTFRLILKPNILIGILIGCINTVIFFTHYIEGVVVLIQSVFFSVVLFSKDFTLRNKIKVICYYIFGFSIFLFYVNKWKILFLELLHKGGNNMVPYPKFSDIFMVLVELMNSSLSFVILLVVLFTYQAYRFVSKINTMNQSKKWIGIYLIVFILVSFIIIYLASYKAPMFCRRYLMFTTFAFLILLSAALNGFKSSFYKFGLFLTLLFFFNLNSSFSTEKEMDVKNAVQFIKNKQTSNSLIIIQSRDIISNFTLYYEYNIFKKYWLIEEQLVHKNVIAVNDFALFLKEIDFRHYDKVFLLQVFENFVDPQKNVLKYLKSKLNNVQEINKFKGINLFLFKLEKENLQVINSNNELRRRFYVNKIFSDSTLMKSLISKAQNQKITMDSALRVESNWLISEDIRKLKAIK
jgi:hypothetical protein